jgi:undecaprenyl diphosphate synthase
VESSLPLNEFPNLCLGPTRLPRHIAIVMDGNGRWARQRGLNRCEGHRRGKDSVRAVVEAARQLGIPYLTLFAFSNENWQRPKAEVRFLMQLFHRYLITETKRLMKRDIRVLAVGDMSRLPAPVRRVLTETVKLTADNQTMTVALALSYGGRQDVVEATRRIAQAAASGRITPAQIDEQMLEAELMTSRLPDPDLLIRTSGELRISNFFLYQLAYTELYFTDTLWPDFRERDLLTALTAYQSRERRFGMVDDSPSIPLSAANQA